MKLHGFFELASGSKRGGETMRGRGTPWGRLSRTLLTCGLLLATGSVLYAEQPSASSKIPPPIDIDLESRDGVILKATYYPSTLGKEAVPILMVHEFEGSRSDFAPLALVLQGLGHAALTLDLRGHGESTLQRGSARPLNVKQFTSRQFQLMVWEDMERGKRFLLDKNNEGEVNIEKLCVIGAGMGATLALEWTLLDWSWPQLPTYKQGRDVKALVLISPEFTFRTLSSANLFKRPEIVRRISALILFGDGKPKALEDANRIHGMFERVHPKPEKPEQVTLFRIPLKTNLQGAKLLDEKNLRAFKIDQLIAQFLRLRLVEQPYPWQDRRNPLERNQ